jgi:hypothetical protein
MEPQPGGGENPCSLISHLDTRSPAHLECLEQKLEHTGVLPMTVTRLDRNVIQPQKTLVSIFGLTFYHGLLEHFYRQG